MGWITKHGVSKGQICWKRRDPFGTATGKIKTQQNTHTKKKTKYEQTKKTKPKQKLQNSKTPW